MKWLGPKLRMMFATAPDPELSRLLEVQRDVGADTRATRERLERLAGDPIDSTISQMIEDLRQ